jgi:hypothetical protein
LALNYADGKLFFKNSSNVIKTIGGNTSFVRVTSNTTASVGTSYIADTSAGSFTLTLPASPLTGDTVVVADGANFSTNNLTIARNASTIEGIADDLVLDISGVCVTLVYDSATWEVFTQVGAQGGSEVTLAGTQTLTNKTLTSPSLTTPTITTPSITGATDITYTPGSTTGVALTTTGKDTQGGTGYFDFFRATNTTSGVTNGSKTFRLTSTGTIDIVNSAYTATIASLTNAGNLSVSGTVTPGAYTAGQVIKDTMLSNSDFTVNTTTVATSTSDTDFITYSYTPVSSSSYLIIHVHVGSYEAAKTGGSGQDSYFSRIKVDGTEITYSAQYTRDTYTFRTGALFPLIGRYTNSNTTAKSITVAVRRDSADDSITIVNSATALWMRITEVAR